MHTRMQASMHARTLSLGPYRCGFSSDLAKMPARCVHDVCEVVLSQSAERRAPHLEHLLAGVTVAIAALGERFVETCSGDVDRMVVMVDALEPRGG